jgi:hypothetical protein
MRWGGGTRGGGGVDRAELKRRLMGLPKEAVIDGFLRRLMIDCGDVYREALSSARQAEEAKSQEAHHRATEYLKAWNASGSVDDFEAYMQTNKEGNRYYQRAQAYFHRLMDAYKE